MGTSWIIHQDPATGAPGMTFNPIWLKWFVDLTALLSADPNTGAVTGGQPAGGGQPGWGLLQVRHRLGMDTTHYSRERQDKVTGWWKGCAIC